MDILNDSFISLITAILFGLLLGLIISRGSTEKSAKKDLVKEKKKNEDKDKEIAGEIYESLYQLHQGLVQTVKSYDNAVKTVLEKLPEPTEKIAELGHKPQPIAVSMNNENNQSIEVFEADKKTQKEEDPAFVMEKSESSGSNDNNRARFSA